MVWKHATLSRVRLHDKDTRIVVDAIRCGRVEYTNLTTKNYGELPIDDFYMYYDKIESEDRMTFYEAVNNNFDNPDFDDYMKPGCYNINFIHEGREDQTQFDIYPGQNLTSLQKLWEDFAKENNIPLDSVESVEFAGVDEEMKAEIADVFKNGLVIVRDINEETDWPKGIPFFGNSYLTPDDIRAVLKAANAEVRL